MPTPRSAIAAYRSGVTTPVESRTSACSVPHWDLAREPGRRRRADVVHCGQVGETLGRIAPGKQFRLDQNGLLGELVPVAGALRDACDARRLLDREVR